MGCILHDLGHLGTGGDGVDEADLGREHCGITAHMSVMDASDRVVVTVIKRAMNGYEPCIAPRVPAPLAGLLRALMAVEPSERLSAEAARRQLASLAASSVSWPVNAAAAVVYGAKTV